MLHLTYTSNNCEVVDGTENKIFDWEFESIEFLDPDTEIADITVKVKRLEVLNAEHREAWENTPLLQRTSLYEPRFRDFRIGHTTRWKHEQVILARGKEAYQAGLKDFRSMRAAADKILTESVRDEELAMLAALTAKYNGGI